jgi:adenine-specific DNA-methyltransferase
VAARAKATAPQFVKRRRVGDVTSENRVVAGDNLRALEWLRVDFAGKFRCVYLDPPFNTGRVFPEYDDARTPAQWLAFLRERLLAIVPLLAKDGVLFLEIDDSELGPAIVLCDEIFGRAARVSTITVVRSASTGHKTKNRGPVNVTDFILVYERTPGAWVCNPLRRVRPSYDRAYGTYLKNPDAPHSRWEFESLARVVARDLGHVTAAQARKAVGATGFEAATLSFALAHASHVVRFAQPRYEAVSRAAQKAIDASRANPTKVSCLARPGHPDLILRGGNRLLFLATKTVMTKAGPRLVEPLTNVWDDVPFQGIAGEGQVVFHRNKKPERLLERVLELATREGDWVLDPFLGSGTTAAVAEKMGRRWVGIESGDVLWTLAVPRLERVARGEDVTGITSRRGSRPPRGGGGFSVYS